MDYSDDATNLRICLQLLDAWKTLKAAIERFAEAHGLTLQQIFVLYQLYGDDRILMGTLAKHLHCDASNITGMAERLQALGLIERRELPEDRRAKQLVITLKGRGLIEALLPQLPCPLGLPRLRPRETAELSRLLAKLDI